MKKIFSLFVILLLIAFGFWYFTNGKSQATVDAPKVLEQATENIVDATKPEVAEPTRIIIQKIDVDAQVEAVGQDDKGNMAVPKKDEDVAWYRLGYKPGDNGSAVMAGHFDTRTGSPAVFYNISKLQSGDTIQVVDKNDTTYEYVVTKSVTYDFDEVPLADIFATKGEKMLNLITCDGVFDKSAKNYSKRLVVYSKLKPE